MQIDNTATPRPKVIQGTTSAEVSIVKVSVKKPIKAVKAAVKAAII